MKKYLVLSVLFTLNLTISSVQADVGDQYVLPKFGIMHVFFTGKDADLNVGFLYSLGVMYGIGITKQISLEGEFNMSLAGGSYDIGYETGSYKLMALEGFGVYRYPIHRNVYIKGKLGLQVSNIERDSSLEGKDTDLGYGLSGGAGAGFLLIRSVTLETEITVIERNVVFYNVGIHYPF